MSDLTTTSNDKLSRDETDLLKAVKSTIAETKAPTGVDVDIRAVAAKSVAAYFDAMDKQSSTPSLALTPGFRRAVSRLFDIEPEQEFKREFVSTVAPPIVFLGLLVGSFLVLKRGIVAYSLIGLAVVLSLGLGIARRRINDQVTFLRNSVGSLAGGLVVAAVVMLVGTYGLKLKVASGLAEQNLQASKLEITERNVAEVAFSTVGSQQKDLQAETKRSLLKLEIPASIAIDANKYKESIVLEAHREDLSSRITAIINAYRAEVYSTDSTKPQFRVLTGRISDVGNNNITITPYDLQAGGNSVVLNFESRGFLSAGQFRSDNLKDIQGLRGLDVKVLYSPKTNVAIKMVPTEKSELSTLFYNAALSHIRVSEVQ